MFTTTKQELKIGWASQDISTSEPIGIRGQLYLRISEGVLDPITVNALVIDNNEDCVIFLSADAVGIRSFLVKAIRDKIRELEPELPVGKIIFNATHTHTNGDLYEDIDEFPCAMPRMPAKEYQKFFVDHTAKAIIEAWRQRSPGSIAWGYGYATVGHSRRVAYTKAQSALSPGFSSAGNTMMYGNTDDELFSHYEAGTDSFVNLLYTFDPAGKLTGAIINVPAPSQCTENRWQLSADYWNEVRQILRRQHGDIHLLPQCAAAGDLAPRVMHYKNAQARRFKLKYGDNFLAERLDIAERICEAFNEVLSWASKDKHDHLPIRHIVRTIELDRRQITREEYEFEKEVLEKLEKEKFATEGTPKERLVHDSSLGRRRASSRKIIQRYEHPEKTLPMELHVAAIGNIAFASNRFELYMDYMHRIQARSPFEQTFIIQLAGSEVGENGGTYLATERGETGKGYSASHYSNIVSSQGGNTLVEETLKTLKEIY